MKKLILLVVTIILISGCSKEIPKYTVAFDSNGGTIVEEQIVSENSFAKKPVDPTKDGYDFTGWYYNNQVFDFKTMITKDLTLQARWHKRECNIVCDEDEHINLSKCECTKNVFMEVTSITLDKTSLTLKVGEKTTIKASAKPDNLPFVEIKWSSSNNDVATVDNGVVKAIAAGEAIISAYNGDAKTNIKVKVIRSSINIDSIINDLIIELNKQDGFNNNSYSNNTIIINITDKKSAGLNSTIVIGNIYKKFKNTISNSTIKYTITLPDSIVLTGTYDNKLNSLLKLLNDVRKHLPNKNNSVSISLNINDTIKNYSLVVNKEYVN